MSVNKFGTHIFNENDDGDDDINKSKQDLTKCSPVINFTHVKLYYVLVLPFVGSYNPNERNFELMPDKRTSYKYPYDSGIIISVELPKKDIDLLLNGKREKLEGFVLKKGDYISFRRIPPSTLTTMYAEIQIKSPIIIEL